jgi:hypothetical protein
MTQTIAKAPARQFAGLSMSVTRLAGDLTSTLCVDDEDSTELRSLGMGDKSALMQEIASRWNAHAQLLDFVRQAAVTPIEGDEPMSSAAAARDLLYRLGLNLR